MIGDNGNTGDTEFDEAGDELLDEKDVSEDAMPDIGGDTLVDVSDELRVDELVAKIDKDNPDDIAHKREVRRRLEEISEQRNRDLDSTFNIELNDEL